MTTTQRREPITPVDRPITLADRRERGWLEGLTEGFVAGTAAIETGRQSLRASGARCLTCGQVGLDWRAYTDGAYTRIFDVCPICNDSREHIGGDRP